MNLQEHLNPMQQEAAEHMNGPLLILAGAGSGKTRVLTYRTANLIQKGVSPFNIIAITFTNKAAREMRERISNIIPEGKAVWVSTFHSACVRILRSDIHHIGFGRSGAIGNRFTIYDADDSARLIKTCQKDLNISEKLFGAKAIAARISTFKDEMLNPADAAASASDFMSETAAKVYALYDERLRASNALDFDDIIFHTNRLFTERPDILEQYRDRFIYLMVDEYQDTNTAQYNFIRLLSEKHRNICVVGDDDQSIYAWRGANIQNILDFEHEYPDAKVIKLEQNYRSTKTILKAANCVIKNNSNRKDKTLWTDAEDGEKVIFYNADSDYEEARYIVGEIKKMAEGGASLSDFAVLYRMNASSRVLEENFVRSSLPYRIFGGVNFYGRREIKDMTAYLKLINNPYDTIAFERIINVPRRGIGDQSLEKIRMHADKYNMHLFDAARDWQNIENLGRRTGRIAEFVSLMEQLIEFSKHSTMKDLISKILDDTNYRAEIETEDEQDVARDRLANIEQLITKAAEFDAVAEDKTLAGFLEEISLVADIDALNENDQAVFLMTLHNCKGLEFPCVFIAGFEEGVLPSYRTLNSGSNRELEEERRLCYVGITRAQKKLFITAAKKRMHAGNTNYNMPSRFYEEIDPELLETAGPWYLKKDYASAQDKREPKETHPFTKKGAIKGAKKPEYWQTYNYKPPVRPKPKGELNFNTGDRVKQMRYGSGEVLEIAPAGADYEVTVRFDKPGVGVKKLMAGLARLSKVND